MTASVNISPPRGERVWVQYRDADELTMFLLTSKEVGRDFYFLYEVNDGRLKKLGKARSPVELEEKHGLRGKLTP